MVLGGGWCFGVVGGVGFVVGGLDVLLVLRLLLLLLFQLLLVVELAGLEGIGVVVGYGLGAVAGTSGVARFSRGHDWVV